MGMMAKPRATRNLMIGFAAAAGAFMIVAGIFIYLYLNIEVANTTSENTIKRLTEMVTSATHTVYRAARPMTAGQQLTAGDLEEETILCSDELDSYITPDDIGTCSSLIPISTGTVLRRAMFANDPLPERGVLEVQYDYIEMTSNISRDDYVDIRILFADGTEETVIAKTQVKGLSDNRAAVNLWLGEEEQQLMNSAATDAALSLMGNSTGVSAKIYAKKYISPSTQPANLVTYVPSIQTIELIKNSPNIVQAAGAYLSTELRRSREEKREAIASGTKLWESEEEMQELFNKGNLIKISGGSYAEESETESEEP